MEKTIREYCRDALEETVRRRRYIHAHPETGMEVAETAAYVCAELDAMGISYRKCGDIGVIAEIKGEKAESAAVVMLRADMDALAQEEKTGLPFASEIPGRMHACGHDFHTSMLLGSVSVLNRLKKEFAGTVRFIFQPGEEIGEGAVFMNEHGAMEGVDMGLGIHVDPLAPAGVLLCRRGEDWAAVDHFYITIKGVGAHGATPQDGCDAVVAAGAVVGALQSVASRECDPMKPMVLTIGMIHGGSAFNIICDEVKLEGTVRSFDQKTYDMIPEAMERIVKNVSSAYRCEGSLRYDRKIKPLVNNDEAYDMLRDAALKVLDKPENWQEAKMAMIGEDFSEYCSYAPCVFAHLGADGGYPLHSPYVNFSEDALEYGIAAEVQFALDALEKYSAEK